MVRRLIPAWLAVTAVLLMACDSSASPDAAGVIVDGEPVAAPYDGPMVITGGEERGDGDTGVAGLALECDGEPYRGGAVDYGPRNGLAEVGESQGEVMASSLNLTVLGSDEVPSKGYRRERAEGDRVLLSYDVGEETKVAVVLADGLTDYLDHDGWGVEWWAQCDPAELPAPVAERLGVQVWEDEPGERVPVTEIRSFLGSEHCGWEDITFLEAAFVGPEAVFVRDADDELSRFLTTTFATVDGLPDGGTDTGFHRHGRSLWLAPQRDAAYLVSEADPADVERWPAATEPIGCA